MILKENKVSAADLSKVLITKNELSIKNSSNFTKSDLQYQENRRKRKVRKLDFEIK